MSKLWSAYAAAQPSARRRALRNQLVNRYMPLVHAIARRMHAKLGGRVELDDLVQEGAIGLCDALDRVDEGGGKFAVYARKRIHGRMVDALRAMDWVPRSLRGRQAAAAEMLAWSGLEPRRGMDQLADQRSESPGKELDTVDFLSRALRGLTDQERSVVHMHAAEEMYFREIGERYGMTSAGAFKIYRQALDKIREKGLWAA